MAGEASVEAFVAAFAANDDNFANVASPTPVSDTPDPETDARDGAADPPAGDSDAGDDAGDEAVETDGTDEGAGDAAGDDAGDTPADDAADEDAGDEEALDEEGTKGVKELLGKHIPMSLDDLPAESRPLVEKRLRDVEKGVTRAFQEARSYRPERAQFLADKKFREEHPHLYIAEMLEKDPTILDKVNEELDKLAATPGYKDVATHTRTQAREAATKAITDEQAALDARRSRAAHVHSYTEAGAQKAGIPMALVEDAVVAAIITARSRNEDVTEAQIDQIIADKKKVFAASLDQRRRENRQRDVKAKAEAAKGAPPRAKPAQGAAPTPTRRAPKPVTLEDGLKSTVDALFPGAD